MKDLRKKTTNNGYIRTISYFDKQGKKQGRYEVWFGYEQLAEEGTYKDDKLEGEYKSWHEDGQPYIEATLKDGCLNGLYKEWYRDGQLAEEMVYQDDCMTDNGKLWYRDGTLRLHRTSDFHKEWYNNGKPSAYISYRDRTITIWDENGKIAQKFSYPKGQSFKLRKRLYEPQELSNLVY